MLETPPPTESRVSLIELVKDPEYKLGTTNGMALLDLLRLFRLQYSIHMETDPERAKLKLYQQALVRETIAQRLGLIEGYAQALNRIDSLIKTESRQISLKLIGLEANEQITKKAFVDFFTKLLSDIPGYNPLACSTPRMPDCFNEPIVKPNQSKKKFGIF